MVGGSLVFSISARLFCQSAEQYIGFAVNAPRDPISSDFFPWQINGAYYSHR